MEGLKRHKMNTHLQCSTSPIVKILKWSLQWTLQGPLAATLHCLRSQRTTSSALRRDRTSKCSSTIPSKNVAQVSNSRKCLQLRSRTFRSLKQRSNFLDVQAPYSIREGCHTRRNAIRQWRHMSDTPQRRWSQWAPRTTTLGWKRCRVAWKRHVTIFQAMCQGRGPDQCQEARLRWTLQRVKQPQLLQLPLTRSLTISKESWIHQRAQPLRLSKTNIPRKEKTQWTMSKPTTREWAGANPCSVREGPDKGITTTLTEKLRRSKRQSKAHSPTTYSECLRDELFLIELTKFKEQNNTVSPSTI